MSKQLNVGAVVFPKELEFQIQVGSVTMGSRTYANSSNAYRGCRAAIRNLLRNRNVTNESNYGTETVAITNNNGFVIAANEYARANTASKAAATVLLKTKGVKKLQLEVENS